MIGPAPRYSVRLARDVRVDVSTLAAASAAFRTYLDEKLLGASDLNVGDGQVYDRQRLAVVARVSYNGRVWDIHNPEVEIKKED